MPPYKVQKPFAEPLPDLQASELEQHLVNRQRLKEHLLEEVEAAKLKEAALPARVPAPSDYSSIEHTQPQKLARIHAIVNFRGPVEFKDDNVEEKEQLFFGIPKLRHVSKTVVRPYEGRRSIGTIRTR